MGYRCDLHLDLVEAHNKLFGEEGYKNAWGEWNDVVEPLTYSREELELIYNHMKPDEKDK